MTLRKPSLVFLLALPFLLVTGCSGDSTESGTSRAPTGETVVLRVGNRFLTGRELNQKTDKALEDFRSTHETDLTDERRTRLRKRLTRRVLRKTLVNFLLLSAARDAGTSVNEKAFSNRWRSYRENLGGTRALETQLEQSGQSREELRKHLKQNLILKDYLEGIIARPEPGERKLREYYRENREQFVETADTGSASFEDVRLRVGRAYRIRSQEQQLRERLKELWDRYEIELEGRSLDKETFFEQLDRPASLLN